MRAPTRAKFWPYSQAAQSAALESGLQMPAPTSNTVSLINSTQTGDYKWGGIAAAANGKLYAAPYYNDNVLVVDPAQTPANQNPEFRGMREEATRFAGGGPTRTIWLYLYLVPLPSPPAGEPGRSCAQS